MHLGIMTFLRRSRKDYPPLPSVPQAPDAAVKASAALVEPPPPVAVAGVPDETGRRNSPEAASVLDSGAATEEPNDTALAILMADAEVPADQDDPARTAAAAAPVEYRSEHYAYSLTLPAGWTIEPPRTIAGSPPVERFRSPDGVTVGVWNEPCPLCTLPRPEGPTTAISLANKRSVRFASYVPNHDRGSRFLEGAWLAHGRRWSAHIQLPGAGEMDMTIVRQLFATFAMAEAADSAG